MKEAGEEERGVYDVCTRRASNPPATLCLHERRARGDSAASNKWEKWRTYGASRSRGWIETNCGALNCHPAEGFRMTGAVRCSWNSCRQLQAIRRCRLQPTSTRCLQRGYTSSERQRFVHY